MENKKFELKEGQCSIFKNDKNGNEKAPDYKGTIKIEGIEKDIALWVKEGNKGKFFSGQVKDKYVKPQDTRTAEQLKEQNDKPERSQAQSDGTDSLPF